MENTSPTDAPRPTSDGANTEHHPHHVPDTEVQRPVLTEVMDISEVLDDTLDLTPLRAVLRTLLSQNEDTPSVHPVDDDDEISELADLVGNALINNPSNASILVYHRELNTLEQRSGDHVKVVLTGEAFASIPAEPTDSSHLGVQCTVCLHDFELHEQLVCLPKCRHRFHSQCARDWLTLYKRSCPNCRMEVDGETQILGSTHATST